MNYSKKIRLLGIVWLLICFLSTGHISGREKEPADTYGIVIHGGAGVIAKKTMDAKNERLYREKLTEALTAGYRILENNGSSVDAVEAAIKVMEDSPLFNSGKGAVFTGEGTNELDASIMDGKTLNAGAVAGVRRIKNPVSLARLVMEKSPHVLLVGEGAEAFARQEGMDWVSPDYFFTKRRWKALQKIKAKEKKEKKKTSPGKNALNSIRNEETGKFGTVGAVALDKNGNLAAGTSTGGMMNKKFGRVGDSPVIGAGTYANNKTCAVSATGHGEYFIRSVAAYDISALMEYKGLNLQEASELVVEKLKKLGGIGGFIAIDGRGNISMPFSSAGMFRGYALKGKKLTVKMYKE
jgi:beta-aspartyl-peptidase (threonine type)